MKTYILTLSLFLSPYIGAADSRFKAYEMPGTQVIPIQDKASGAQIEAFITLLKNKKDESLSLTLVVIEGSHQSAFPLTALRAVEWLAKLSATGDKK